MTMLSQLMHQALSKRGWQGSELPSQPSRNDSGRLEWSVVQKELLAVLDLATYFIVTSTAVKLVLSP
jgi:hypothetical protein